MASSSIQPAILGGYGRQIEDPDSDASRGGLIHREFSSHSPPDIQPNTRIIAVCGITDYIQGSTDEVSSDEDDDTQAPIGATSTRKTGAGQIASKAMAIFSARKRQERRERKKAEKKATAPEGLASPREDGWFFSDFFLFHHLFLGLGKDNTLARFGESRCQRLISGIGASQRWITSESPRCLVNKYGEYGHGGPKTDHRVVLNKNMLDQIENDPNLRVFKRADLLEDFIRTLKDECRVAAGLNQPLLLMIFGHGDPKTYGIAIGGSGPPRKAPRLRTAQIAACLRGLDISLTLLLTSCYSGGWVLQPELNISAFTAAGPENMSRAWDASLGGRSHGSLYATAVREALIKMEDERATQLHPYRARDPLDEEASSSTYAELTKVIHSTLLYEIDPEFGPQDDIQFSAQDDMWEIEWRKRSGVPLAEFQAQWDKLPRLAPQSTAALFRRKTGGIASLSLSATKIEDRRSTYGLHRKFSELQASRIIKDMSFGYLNSFPPPSNTGPDGRVHRLASRCLEGIELASPEMDELRHALTYRLEAMKAASEYKNIIGIDYVDCNDFDLRSWEYNAHHRAGGKASHEMGEKWLKYARYRRIILNADLFTEPTLDQGWYYTKPYEYLAAACVDGGLDEESVNKAVLKALAEKSARVEALTMKVRKDPTVRRVSSKIFSTLGKRMRSASPPQGRASLPSFSEIIG